MSHGIEILHESPELLLVLKPEGLATIAERDLGVPCVQRLLEAERGERLWVVHRLDKEVSGALVFARSAAAHRELCQAFEAHTVKKTYLGLVHGVVKAASDVIDMPICEFGSGRMAVDRRGKPSRTGFRVLQRSADCSLLEIELHTGRRHQIRVHLYASEHPLIGDTRYGTADRGGESLRLMLHAWKLVLPPHGAFEAPLPPSFVTELQRRGLRSPA